MTTASALFPNTSPLHLVVVVVVLAIALAVGTFLVALALSGKISAEEQASDLESLMNERARHGWVKVNDAHSVCTCGATGTWVLETLDQYAAGGDFPLTVERFIITAPPHVVDAAAARFHAVRQYV